MCTLCASHLLLALQLPQSLYFFAIIASSQDLAFVFAVLWTCPNVFVDPFMQRTYQLGWGVTWMRYLSPAGFAWQALLQLEMAGRGFDCSKDVGLRSIGLVPGMGCSDLCVLSRVLCQPADAADVQRCACQLPDSTALCWTVAHSILAAMQLTRPGYAAGNCSH